MKKTMKRRGQVTLFIILGIIMVLAAMFFFYMRADITKISYTEKVPESIIPFQRFVENCIDSTTREAVQKLGMSGGYIELPPNIKNNPFARLSIAPEVDYIIPYWYYRKGGTIKDNDLSPTLDMMTADITKYVNENIAFCLNNFTAFQNIYKITEKGNTIFQTRITDNSVVVLLDYPVEIIDASKKPTLMKKFRAELPIRLKKMYELAREIFDAENTGYYLENTTFNDLMSLSEKVVPITDVKFGVCNPFIKKISDIKTNIQNMVNFNLPYVRINGTKIGEFVLPDERYYDNHMVWNMGLDNKGYENISVNLNYETNWPMRLSISPNYGYYVRADPLKIAFFVNTCFMNYQFTYDLEYPVVINLIDGQTADHEAYSFQYVMPVMINHNKGDKINNPTRTYTNLASGGGEEDYCTNYPSRTIQVEARDEITREDLNHVNVSFRCIDFDCKIGEIKPIMGVYKLDGAFPRCNYGTAIAKKEGYFDTEMKGIDSKTQTLISINMRQKKTINYTIEKYELDDIKTPLMLDPDESVLIDIKNTDYDYSQTTLYPDIKQIEMIGGDDIKYEINLMIIKNDSLIGGYSANWTASWNDMANSEELVLPIIVNTSIMTDYEAQYMMLENLSKYSKLVEEPKLR
jgi:hypothetical protein